MYSVNLPPWKLSADHSFAFIERDENKIKFPPGDAAKITHLLGIAGSMKSISGVPHISHDRLKVTFAKDKLILSVENEGYLFFNWDETDGLIRAVKAVKDMCVNERILNAPRGGGFRDISGTGEPFA